MRYFWTIVYCFLLVVQAPFLMCVHAIGGVLGFCYPRMFKKSDFR